MNEDDTLPAMVMGVMVGSGRALLLLLCRRVRWYTRAFLPRNKKTKNPIFTITIIPQSKATGPISPSVLRNPASIGVYKISSLSDCFVPGIIRAKRKRCSVLINNNYSYPRGFDFVSVRFKNHGRITAVGPTIDQTRTGKATEFLSL